MKRALDVVVAGLGLAVLSPALFVIALAVKVSSRGPVLFKQERVGRHQQLFEIYKFRTMRVGVSGPAVTSQGDKRITWLGQLLRTTKLDEVPQLLNVLRGEMSLVGPRPEVPAYVAHWPAKARERILSERPGITDPASIVYRREAEEIATADDPERYYLEVVMPKKVALYVEYVEQRSLINDVRLIAKTLVSVARD